MLSVPGPAGQAFAKVMRADPLGLHDLILDRLAGERHFAPIKMAMHLFLPTGAAC